MKRFYSMIAAVVVGGAALYVMPACQTVTGKVPSTAMEVSAGTGNLVYRASDTGLCMCMTKTVGI